MEFHDLKIKSICNVLKHTPSMKQWYAQDRQTHILGIQLCGVMHHNFDTKEITLNENSVFFFNQRENFQAVVKELGQSYCLHFTTYEPIDTESFTVRVQNANEVYALLEKIERQHTLHRENDHLASAYFYRLCHLLESYRLQAYHPIDERIVQAKEYLDLHYKEKICLDRAANVCHISRRRFNDLFKNQYGVTPNRYLTSLKITSAKELLPISGLSLKEIAELSGFEDFYYFSKVFKAETGLSPSVFRKNKLF